MSKHPSSTHRLSPATMFRRGFFLMFTLGLIASFALMLVAATQTRQLESSGTVRIELASLVFFTSTRTIGAGYSSAELVPGFGVAVLLLVLPTIYAVVAYQRARAHPAARAEPLGA